MPPRRLSLVSATALLLAATAAAAQSPAPPGPDAGAGVGAGLTLDRFLERQTGRIMAADTDGDGRISRAEMDAMTPKSGRNPGRRFDAMDANHDGYLDKAEIQAALTSRVRRMDRDGNGILTPDERMGAKRRAGQGRPAEMPAAPQP